MKFRNFFKLFCVLSLLSSCNQTGIDPYSAGIGSGLNHANLNSETAAQDNYVSLICRQAGGGSACDVDWNKFVLAGMNDIDSRCDLYLGWLDAQRRSNGPIQKQIADTATTTGTIMSAAGATATAMGIVAAAFGFARNTFDNSRSRLLMEVNHSTVQSIVLTNQGRFRKELAGVNADSRPVAIYVLRQYLRICMPYTIENEINSTITTYQMGGTQALTEAEKNPLIALSSLKREVIKPQTVIVRPPAVVIPNAQYLSIVKGAEKVSTTLIVKALAGVCAPQSEIDLPTAATVVRVKVLQQYRRDAKGATGKKIDGKMDSGDLAEAAKRPCNTATSKNFYEMEVYPQGVTAIGDVLITAINQRLPESERISAGADVATIRAAIAKARIAIRGELELVDPSLDDQLTEEFVQKI